VINRGWCVAALVAVTPTLAACGGSDRSVTEGSSGASAFSTDTPASRAGTAQSLVAPGTLAASTSGPMTCTVYDGYATQIIFDSERLDVRAECQVWSANRPGTGYLWGYERAAATPGALHLCSLTDARQRLTAIVIEETGFVPVSAAERAKGRAACVSIRAAGWAAPSMSPQEARIRRRSR
jgi:hypothetical protein